MAPDAPPPTYDRHGNLVSDWAVRISYDSVRDQIGVYWSIKAGPYNKASTGFDVFDPQDVEDAISAVQRAVRICGARRLF